MTKYEDLYLELIDLELFSEKELELITNINGDSVETLNDCIYARYGYRNIDQLMEDNS